ncbi:MAG: hypothetical protein PHY47_25555 [Lachnospiraceae bacterium]|nr:hypothetical protein [Lachnospiraceae bacterium]
MAQDDASIQRLVQQLMAGLPDSTIYTVQQDCLCFGELEIYIQERRVLIAERQIMQYPVWYSALERSCYSTAGKNTSTQSEVPDISFNHKKMSNM